MSWPVPPHGFLGSQASTAATDNDTYQISRSLRFNSADSAYLSRTPSVAGNRKTWTFSAWAKRTTTGSAQSNYILGNAQAPSGTNGVYFGFGADSLFFGDYGASGWDWYVQSSSLYRDTSAWYHIVAQYDTTQATASERVKLYVNGVRLTAFDGASTYPTLNVDGRFNQASVEMAIGRLGTFNGNYFNGYITEVNFIDGQALTPSSFGETDAITGRWKAKAYAGTYGTNGFYLPFTNQSTAQNIFTYSEDFSNAVWIKYQSTCVANSTTAPNGAPTADKLVINNGQTHGQFVTSFLATDNATYTASAYVKALDFDTGTIYMIKKNGTLGSIDFNLSTVSIGNAQQGATGTITAVGSGWYRVTITQNVLTGGTTNPSVYYHFNGTGDGVKGVYIWGAQLEASSSAGPYMYTGASAQTTALTVWQDSSVSAGGYNSWVSNNLSVTPGVGNDSLTDSPSNYGTISTTLVNDTYQISKSLRFNSADSAYLSRTPSVAGNRKTWTWSGWVKRGTLGGNNVFMGNTDASGYNGLYFQFDTNNNITIGDYGVGSYVWVLTTSQVFRDSSSWYHIVATFDSTQVTASDRVSLYINGTKITAFSNATYPSPKDLDGRINSTQLTSIGRLGSYNGFYFEGYLAEVNFIDGQALTPDSFGTRDINTYLWKPKAYTGTYGTNGFYLNFSDSSNTTATTLGKDQAGSNNWTPSGTPGFSVSAGPGNDSLVDSPTYYGTDAGAGGEARGNYATMDPTYPGSVLSNGNLRSTASFANSTLAMASGKYYFEATPTTSTVIDPNSYYVGVTGGPSFCVYALSGNRFNGTSWVAFGNAFVSGDVIGVAVDTSAGTVNFYRNNVLQGAQTMAVNQTVSAFSSISASNTGSTFDFNFGQRAFAYAAPTGFKALRDYNKLPTPTGGEVRGNYCTLNPLDFSCPGTISNGNLQYVQSTLNPRGGRSTIAVSSGKWYWEVTNNGGNNCPGIIRDTGALTSSYIGSNADGWGYFIDGQKYNSGTGTNYGASYTTNDVIGIALNMDAGTLVFYKNGVSQGTAFSGLSGTMSPAFSSSNGSAVSFTVNFGQRPWAYDAPFGFMPLCTTLLPQPIVQKSSRYMDVVTYTGNSASRSITGLGFSPDFVWFKLRQSGSHALFDSVRGATKLLSSNATNIENTWTDELTAFNSDGFSLGVSANTFTNASGNTYVAWAWDESPIAGLDIVSYSGTGVARTVPHNLGVPPKMIIAKLTNSAGFQWPVYHSSLASASNYLWLNDATFGSRVDATFWGTAPTSSVFSVGTNANVNNNTSPYIAYCFAEVEGFSKFGSYTGNSAVDGPFVYCGFRPRFIMIRRTDAGDAWIIKDTARSVYNGLDVELYPASSAAEGGPYSPPIMDYLSNGFKLRSNTSASNGSGNYIFAAFAESPFKYSRAR